MPTSGPGGAGAFAVLIALGGTGTDAAIGMIVIQLLASGILQQTVHRRSSDEGASPCPAKDRRSG